jgi:hypothetical protein
MNQTPKYRYADEVTKGNVPVQIIDGKFEGIMVRYDKIVLQEVNGELHFDYDYEIVRNPDDIEMCDELRDTITKVMVSVLEEQIADMPDDMDLLKEGNSEEHRKSDTPKSPVQ